MFDFHVTKSQGSGATIAQLQGEWYYDVTTVLFGKDMLVVSAYQAGTYIHSMNGEPLAKDGKFVGYEVKP